LLKVAFVDEDKCALNQGELWEKKEWTASAAAAPYVLVPVMQMRTVTAQLMEQTAKGSHLMLQ
jgi:hypothetical protein